MEAILAVTSKLAAPFDLLTMLSEVVSAAKQVLRAERGSVWLYDPAADQLVLEIATGIAPVRVPADAGIAGACARERRIINVPDCYTDERFNPEVDRHSGNRTRCMLTLPRIDHKYVLVKREARACRHTGLSVAASTRSRTSSCSPRISSRVSTSIRGSCPPST